VIISQLKLGSENFDDDNDNSIVNKYRNKYTNAVESLAGNSTQIMEYWMTECGTV
jgi:hypothetical protein